MIPILYAPTVNIVFDNYGSTEYPNWRPVSWTKNLLGYLPDCVRCTHTEERNGAWELELEYPDTGTNAKLISVNCILQVKGADPLEDEDYFPMFRIYRVTRDLTGVIRVFARHVSEWLSHISFVGKLFYDDTFHTGYDGHVSDPGQTWGWMNRFAQYGDEGLPFDFYSDVASRDAVFTFSSPTSVKSYLGGGELPPPDRSFLQVWGGEYKYAGWQIQLLASRGKQDGYELRYAHNISGINIDEDVDDVATVILGYFQNEDTIVVGDRAYSSYRTAFPYDRIKAIDFTQNFASDLEGGYTTPSSAQLKAAAEAYIAANDIGNPVRKIDADIVQLEQTSEYRDLYFMSSLLLCDTVRLVYARGGLNINADMKVVELTYDVLRERTTNVKIGTIQRTMVRELAQNTLYRQYRTIN